jgi:hypothetical protein
MKREIVVKFLLIRKLVVRKVTTVGLVKDLVFERSKVENFPVLGGELEAFGFTDIKFTRERFESIGLRTGRDELRKEITFRLVCPSTEITRSRNRDNVLTRRRDVNDRIRIEIEYFILESFESFIQFETSISRNKSCNVHVGFCMDGVLIVDMEGSYSDSVVDDIHVAALVGTVDHVPELLSVSDDLGSILVLHVESKLPVKGIETKLGDLLHTWILVFFGLLLHFEEGVDVGFEELVGSFFWWKMVLLESLCNSITQRHGFLKFHMCPCSRNRIEREQQFSVLFTTFWEDRMIEISWRNHAAFL